MKKWIILVIAIVVIIMGSFVKVYLTAVDPVKSAEKKAVALAKTKVSLSKVDDFHLYHGLETVYVIEGKTKKGEKIIVWIPEKSKKVFVKNAKAGLTKQEAIQKFAQSKNPNKIVSVRLGMEKEIPFWEIYYVSNQHLINYYYIHFQTGEWLKKIENL